MSCPNCRKAVPEGEKFCPGCGCAGGAVLASVRSLTHLVARSLQPKVAPSKMDGTAQVGCSQLERTKHGAATVVARAWWICL